MHCAGRTLVLSSVSENLPLAVIEALCCGLPVAATDVGGVRAAVGTDGAFAPVGDPKRLAGAIAAVLDHYEQFDRRRIATRAAEAFSFEAVGRVCGRDLPVLVSRRGRRRGFLIPKTEEVATERWECCEHIDDELMTTDYLREIEGERRTAEEAGLAEQPAQLRCVEAHIGVRPRRRIASGSIPRMSNDNTQPPAATRRISRAAVRRTPSSTIEERHVNCITTSNSPSAKGRSMALPTWNVSAGYRSRPASMRVSMRSMP